MLDRQLARLADVDLLSEILDNFKCPERRREDARRMCEAYERDSSAYFEEMALGGEGELCVAGGSVAHIAFSLPTAYPDAAPPTMSVRCDGLSRSQHDELHGTVRQFFAESLGDPSATQAVALIQEQLAALLPSSHDAAAGDGDVPPEILPETKETVESSFVRQWIYFHHIYSKTKKHQLAQWAAECHLSGFILVGKPGVACLEGPAEAVDDFTRRVRRLSWQRMTVRERESGTAVEARFTGPLDMLDLDESTAVGSSAVSSSRMSQLKAILSDHQLEHMFVRVLNV